MLINKNTKLALLCFFAYTATLAFTIIDDFVDYPKIDFWLFSDRELDPAWYFYLSGKHVNTLLLFFVFLNSDTSFKKYFRIIAFCYLAKYVDYILHYNEDYFTVDGYGIDINYPIVIIHIYVIGATLKE